MNREQWIVFWAVVVWVALWAWTEGSGLVGLRSFLEFDILLRFGGTPLSLSRLAIPVTSAVVYGGLRMGLRSRTQWVMLGVVAVWVGMFGRGFGLNGWVHGNQEAAAESLLVLIVGAGLGGALIGLFAPHRLWPRFKQWLATPQRKQLATLLAAATWVSVVVLSEGSGGDALAHVFVLSLPAALFAGIFVWYFARKHDTGTHSDAQSQARSAAEGLGVSLAPGTTSSGSMPRTYRWGTAQGYLLMIGAAFTFLLAAFNAFLFFDSADILGWGQREPLLRTSVLAVAAAVAAFPAGVGIVQKRRYGLGLFHFLWALNTIGSLALLGLSWLVLAGALWWLANTVYFHKRRHEFT